MLLSLTVGAAARAATRQRSLTPRWQVVARGGAATDGRYTILWGRRRGVLGTVFDELTGQRTRVALPSSCPQPVGAQGFLGDTWLLVPCPHSAMELYGLATGQWRTVVIPALCRHRVGRGPSCQPQAVGTDWIKYDEDRGNLGDRWLFQNIVTGAVRNDPTNAHTEPGLDSPLLINPVCAPLRVPSEASQNTLELDGRFAVLSTGSGIFLEHCATHLHQLLTDAAPWVTVAPGEIMWAARPAGSLQGILLPSRRRFSVSRPGHADVADIVISDRHLYVIGDVGRGATATTTGIVWSAPLSALRGS